MCSIMTEWKVLQSRSTLENSNYAKSEVNGLLPFNYKSSLDLFVILLAYEYPNPFHFIEKCVASWPNEKFCSPGLP